MTTKAKLHQRNQHLDGYDFARLLKDSPELKEFTTLNPVGKTTINFQNAKAVRALNRALLKTHYKIDFWDIPAKYLCPPIPGRVDYIHYLADLLAQSNHHEIPRGRDIKALDIGTGASLVYPLTGQSEYGWHFTGVDIDAGAIKSARQICETNKLDISVRRQDKPENIFQGVINPRERFHITMCNPPFHASLENGEIKFVARMVKESVAFSHQCLWFTSLVSKKDNLSPLGRILKKAGVLDFKVIEMAQGQKTSRFIAWTFLKKAQRVSFMKYGV